MKIRTCSMKLSTFAWKMYNHVDYISPKGKTNNPCTSCGSHQLWRLRIVVEQDDGGQRVVNYCIDCLGKLVPAGLGSLHAGKIHSRYSLDKFENELECSLCKADPRGGVWASKYETTKQIMLCETCVLKHIVSNSVV